MADLASTEFAYRFAAGVKTDQQPNPIQGAYFRYAGTPGNDDTIKLFVLPKWYVLHSLIIQYDAVMGTTGTFDLGLHEFNAVTGAIGDVVDVDCYMDLVDAIINDTFTYPSGLTIDGLLNAAQSIETAVTVTMSAAGTGQAGEIRGTYIAMATALP